MSRRFRGFRRIDEEPRVEGEPWWEQGDCADLIENFCVQTPYGIVLLDELFNGRGEPVDRWVEAYGFEGVVVAGGEIGVWVEGPCDEIVPVRLQ